MSNLPPLTEKIDKGAAGGHEFERLLHRLLLREGQRRGYHYEVASSPAGDWRGVDGLIRKGYFLGLGVPVGVQFKWLWGDPTLDSSKRRQVTESIEQAVRQYPDLKHWVLVTPHELSKADKDWFDGLKLGQLFSLHHCGQIQIEEWLDAHPTLLARYYSEAARQHPEANGYDGTDLRGWVEQYRAKVVASQRNFCLLGLPTPLVERQDKSGEISLKQIFVPQTLKPWSREGQPMQTLAQLVHEAGNGLPPTDASFLRTRAFQQPRPCVLLGDPGCGKSIVLQFLSLLYGGEAQLGNAHVEPRVPLFLSLREFVHRQEKQRPFNFVDALVDHAHSTYQMQSAHPFFFESLLLMGEAIVLMDGLDEVGDAARREQIARAVESFHREYPSCSLWVTSRLVGYIGNTRLSVEWFDHFTVERFDLHQQHHFIRNWYAAHLPNDAPAREERVNSLISAVRRTPGVERLASNPLLLTLITLIHHHAGRLPQNRCQLYDMSVDMLLEEWQQVKVSAQPNPLHARGILSEDAKRWLAGLALWMQQRNEAAKSEDARGLVSEGELSEKLVELRLAARRDNNVSAATDDTKAFINYIRARTGLLVYRGESAGQGQFAFAHLSFQEYLAAYQLSEDRSCTLKDHLEFFREYLGHPAWEETLLLLLYRLSQSTGRQSFPELFAKDFIKTKKKSRAKSPVSHAPALWVTLGRALRDNVNFAPATVRTIIEHLLGYWLVHSRAEAIYDPCFFGVYLVEDRPLHPVFEGGLFRTLEEIALFSERWQHCLAELLEEAWLNLPPDAAVACIHLHARLLPLPKDAVEKLRQRRDLEVLAPDLVGLWLRQDNACCLVEQPTMHQCLTALSSLDCGEVHLRTLSWVKAPQAKAQRPEGLHAALAFLVRKILAELASRAAFAAHRCTEESAALFLHCGTIRVTHQLYRLEMPLAALRTHALHIKLSPGPSRLLWPLSVRGCLKMRQSLR